jgi:hypothetical protein
MQENNMTTLLEKAFKKASILPNDIQDEIAEQLLEDIESEEKWQTAFINSQDKLEKLADKALEDFKSGKGKHMGIDEL